MTGAELKTLRESLGLTVAWVAEQAQVKHRTVTYWESGRFPVPSDVAAMLTAIESQLHNRMDALDRHLMVAHRNLIRYRTDSDLWDFEPDLRPLPATSHAAMLGWLRHKRFAQGWPVGIVWMNPGEYREWLGHSQDDPTKRFAWAAQTHALERHKSIESPASVAYLGL